MSNERSQAKQYAQAVLQAMVERWQGVLSQANAAIRDDAALSQTLRSSESSVDEKMSALRSALSEELSPEAENLLKILIQQGDVDLMPDVSAALADVASGQSAPVKAEVISAAELTDEEKQQLQQKLSAQYGSGLLFNFRIDPSLLGGLRIRVGDRLIDHSVAARLGSMRESIASALG